MPWVKVTDFVNEVKWNDTVRAPYEVDSGYLASYGFSGFNETSVTHCNFKVIAIIK